MKNLIIIICIFSAFSASSQSSAGLVAHWDMNGSVNDVSGNGHTGHANNLTPAAGITGVPNTAYYFNGINSNITVSNAPDLNVSQYSICATIKVMGFYNGFCQVNSVFQRGPLCCITSSTDLYALVFYDNPYDGDDCSSRDTTKDVFIAEMGSYSVLPITVWQYTPQIINDRWYKVVATWDGTKWNIFVNDTLKTSTMTTGGTSTTGTDSICIGMDIFEPGIGNSDQFNGIMDDIRFYNRVLTDSEIHIYSNDSCGFTTQPTATLINLGANAVFSVATVMSDPAYQWQENFGTGFVNLINVPPYSGVTTPSLTITSAGMSLNSTNYRCIVTNANCTDTSNAALLTIHNSASIKNTITSDNIDVYPNPANNFITIRFPEEGTGYVQLLNNLGQTVLQQSIIGQNQEIDVKALPSNVYTLRIQYNGNTFYKKMIKN